MFRVKDLLQRLRRHPTTADELEFSNSFCAERQPRPEHERLADSPAGAQLPSSHKYSKLKTRDPHLQPGQHLLPEGRKTAKRSSSGGDLRRRASVEHRGEFSAHSQTQGFNSRASAVASYPNLPRLSPNHSQLQEASRRDALPKDTAGSNRRRQPQMLRSSSPRPRHGSVTGCSTARRAPSLARHFRKPFPCSDNLHAAREAD